MMVAAPAAAAVVYDEDASGDLSNSGLTPTALDFSLGSNEVLGHSGGDEGSAFRDYFTFTVQPGQLLAAIEVLPGTTSLGNMSFIGLQAGDQVTVAPDAGSAAGLLGWWHFSPDDINTDILDNMSEPAAGSSGFSTPLGPGAYAIWIQEGNEGTSDYGFSFQLTQADVPEPGSLAVLLTGLGFGWQLSRRRRRS
jgi:hypothetical protein